MSAVANITGTVGGWLNSTQDLEWKLPPHQPEFALIPAKRIVRRGHGTYALMEQGDVARRRLRPTLRPGKIEGGWANQPAEAVLESAFAGPGAPLGAFDRARDEDVWQTGLRFAREQSLDGQLCYRLSTAIFCLLAIRAGTGKPAVTELP
jgi:hypothetical protein